MTKIGTAYVIWLLVCTLIATHSLTFFVLLIHSPLFLLNLGKKFLKKFRENQFRKQFEVFLTKIILKMRSGCSFRESIAVENSKTNGFLHAKLSKIIGIVVFLQQNNLETESSFALRVLKVFKAVDKNPVNSIQRLDSFRYQLEIESDLRHRSGQALKQNRTQGAVLAVLYVFLLLFVVSNFGIEKNLAVIILSMFLFLLGSILLLLMGRKKKWKL